MENNCFIFLENRFPDIAEDCFYAEKYLVEEDYEGSIMRMGVACEKIVNSVCQYRNKDFLLSKGLKSRIKSLSYYFIISKYIAEEMHKLRDYRNKVAHAYLADTKRHAEEGHHSLYTITTWFYKVYGDSDFESDIYDGPIWKKQESFTKENIPEVTSDLSENKVTSQYHKDNVMDNIEDVLEEVIVNEETENTPRKVDNIHETVDDTYEQVEYTTPISENESYLYNELSKLSISSKDSVESADDLSDFKKYIHVDRSIQEDFIKELESIQDNTQNHLIMLCGSVGDGKSHLLAYLKTEYPELYEKFTIHNDATESSDPQKTATDELAKVLKPFDDENINQSENKLILAINLGVLNNFLESDYCKTEFIKLEQIINEAKLFDTNTISRNKSIENVSFITFSDYNLFELTGNKEENYVTSEYISSLFSKITKKEDNNCFYQAYLKDKSLGYTNPLIYNYEMFF